MTKKVSELSDKREQCDSYTNTKPLSALLCHPIPTTADGAAVNVGVKSVLIFPVAVYVGAMQFVDQRKRAKVLEAGRRGRTFQQG
jgi:hypothetical protein